jgi:hypothetical protein
MRRRRFADDACAIHGSRLAKRCAYVLDDNGQSADDQVVWKSQYNKSRALELCVSFGVLDLRIRNFMCAAIGLDDNFSRKANEVREIRPNRRPPPKSIPINLMIA